MESHTSLDAVRLAMDLIIFAIALSFLFFFVAKMSEAIDLCMPQTEIIRIR